MSEKKRVFTVLMIDSGGVRGICPSRICEAIEARTGKPIAELFDIIGGVSTGAIVAAGLTMPSPEDPSKPRYTATEITDLYMKEAGKIFPEKKFRLLRQIASTSAYDPLPLEEVLKKYFGATRIGDSLTHLMIPMADIKNFRPAWINHFKGEKDLSKEQWTTMLTRDAIRAATTAPTYFPAKYVTTTPNPHMPEIQHRHTLIDGGFLSGNAMHRMMTKARRLAPPDAEIVLVHLGTGYAKNSLSPEEWNKLGPLGLISAQNGSVILSLAINMGIIDTTEDMRDNLGDRFFSFDGAIDIDDRDHDPSIGMDDASPANMDKLLSFADRLISENADDFDRLCKVLNNRIVVEKDHSASAEALAAIITRMEKIHTVSTLARTYKLVLDATQARETPCTDPEDMALQRLARQLRGQHQAELDRTYNVLKDKLDGQSRLVGTMKETGERLEKMFGRLKGRFNTAVKDAPPDSSPQPPPTQKPPAPPK